MNSQMPVPASDVDKNMNLANPSSSSRIISASVSDKSAAKFAPSIKKCTQYLMGKSAPKSETFTCAICLEDIPEELGILLEECQHKFCRFCLKNVIHFKEKPKAECPYYSCKKQIQERVVVNLLSIQEFVDYLQSTFIAMTEACNIFHCRTLNCIGLCYVENGLRVFKCSTCLYDNCILCKAIHVDQTCAKFKSGIKLIKQAEEAATKKRIKQLLREGKAKYCPTCKYLIEKNGGCDHMRCTNCSTTFDWEREELTSNWMGILSLSHQRAISYRNYIMLRFS